MVGREQANPVKVEQVKQTVEIINKYPIVGLLNLHKMPAAALQRLKYDLADKITIKVLKKTVIEKALAQTDKKILLEQMNNQPALLFTETSPFKIYNTIKKNKKPASAKAGDVALNDIEVKAGPTELMPGPAISTLSKAKIPAKVESGKIAIIKDKLVAKKGDVIDAELASVLQMLKIQPMEVGLDISAIFENDLVYLKDALDIDEEKTMADLREAVMAAMNLSVNAGYVTKDNIQVMIIKAFNEARGLSLEAGIISKEIIGDVLSKAVLEMKALEDKVGAIKTEEPVEKKEEDKSGDKKEGS